MTKKIAIIADIHSNKEALQAVLEDIHREKCKDIINLGDCIAIGAEPAQVLNLINENKIQTVLGNHDTYFLYGLDDQNDICKDQQEGEYNHQRWTHKELNKDHHKFVGAFPSIIEKKLGEYKLLCMHYPHIIEDEKISFSLFTNEQSAENLRPFFDMYEGDIFAFGHNHSPCSIYDEERQRYYINPGSLGCSSDNFVSYAILSLDNDKVLIEHRKVKYNKDLFVSKMLEKKPPEYENILKWFHGVHI